MLKKPTQSRLTCWALTGLLMALCIASLPNLVSTGQPASGKDWAVRHPVTIATEVAACFPDRLAGDKLLLPEGVNPIIVRDAILAAFDRDGAIGVARQRLARVPRKAPHG